jgi:SPP1 family predicted phage head-tail adaptor
VNPGQLDRLVTVRYPLHTRSETGHAIESWVTGAVQSWGKWLPTTGREFIAAGAKYAEQTGMLRLRYRSDIAETWRVIIEGITYDILAVLEVGRREFLDLSVKRSRSSVSITPSAQVFEVWMNEGDVQCVVTYPIPFTEAPRGIHVTQIIPAGGFTFTHAVSFPSRTLSGCTIELGAAVPAAGYGFSIIVTL